MFKIDHVRKKRPILIPELVNRGRRVKVRMLALLAILRTHKGLVNKKSLFLCLRAVVCGIYYELNSTLFIEERP